MANALFSGALQDFTMMRDPLAPSGMAAPTPSSKLERDREKLARAEADLSKAVGEQREYEGLKGIQEKETATEMQRGIADLAKTRAETEAAPELRQRKREMVDAAAVPFVPSVDNAQDMAGLFSLITVLGFAIGAGGKGHAIQAMNAMNGMMEGYQAGRQDIYKREKDLFDNNLKSLKQKIDSINSELEDVAKTAAIDYNKGVEELKYVALKHDADFLTKYADKAGLPKVIEHMKLMEKQAKDAVDRAEKEESRAAEKRLEFQRQLERDRERQQAARELRMLGASLKADQPRGGIQQQFMAQRAVNALGGVASAVESINLLPAGTTAGVLPNMTTKDGMLNAVRNFAARKMSSQEAKAVETLFTGITRNLAAIEASGSATGLVGLASQLEKLRPVAGDTTVDIALKMADIRRVAVENINPLIDSGLMPKQQAEVAKNLVNRIEKAIPYTTNDVLKANMSKPGKETVGEAGARVTGGKTGWSDADEQRLQELERKSRGAQ